MQVAGGQFSGSGDEEFFVGLGRFFLGGSGGYVLSEFAAALRLSFSFDLAHSARRHRTRLKRDDASFTNLNLRAEPVGAVHASRGVKSHRGRDRTFEFISRAGDQAL